MTNPHKNCEHMTKGEYRVNTIVKYDYSEIWRKSDDEMYTDTPLRNDEVVELLNQSNDYKEKLEELKSFRPLYFKSENGVTTLYEKVNED